MRKFLLSKAEAAPIADAFKQVLTVQEYRGKWITASDFGRIINYEFGLESPDSMISSDALVSALSRDIRFKTAYDRNGSSGVFRKDYKPRAKTVYCFFAINRNGTEPESGEGKWFDHITDIGQLCQKRCAIEQEQMVHLALHMQGIDAAQAAKKQAKTAIKKPTPPASLVTPPDSQYFLQLDCVESIKRSIELVDATAPDPAPRPPKRHQPTPSVGATAPDPAPPPNQHQSTPPDTFESLLQTADVGSSEGCIDTCPVNTTDASSPGPAPSKRNTSKLTKATFCEAMSPVSGASNFLRPQKSKPVITARQKGEDIPWTKGDLLAKKTKNQIRNINKMAGEMEVTLATVSGSDMSIAALVLYKLLSKPALAPVRSLLIG